jgi:hypothetical protein
MRVIGNNMQTVSIVEWHHAYAAVQVLTRRGKRLQKHYTVFVCKLKGDRDAYQPKLNEEHSQWKWIAVEELRNRQDVHPVVHACLHAHWTVVQPWLAPPAGEA